MRSVDTHFHQIPLVTAIHGPLWMHLHSLPPQRCAPPPFRPGISRVRPEESCSDGYIRSNQGISDTSQWGRNPSWRGPHVVPFEVCQLGKTG